MAFNSNLDYWFKWSKYELSKEVYGYTRLIFENDKVVK
jgi:hypothetical protein